MLLLLLLLFLLILFLLLIFLLLLLLFSVSASSGGSTRFARVGFISPIREPIKFRVPAMRYILIASVLLLLAGCENVVGPFRSSSPNRVYDSGYPLGTPQRSSRAQPALPDESPWTAPPTGIPRPGSWGVPPH